jgi:hypothetical protein
MFNSFCGERPGGFLAYSHRLLLTFFDFSSKLHLLSENHISFFSISHFLSPTDNTLLSYSIQNNDILEFGVDARQIEDEKPMELEGYLFKEGQKGVLKLWKNRWFSTHVRFNFNFLLLIFLSFFERKKL